ncbi:methyltransferase [Vibrio zhugei]|uniref:Ribosomal RNA large subunit methyltransferase G n=1 Tax=Vibrio zhugei TaxID=2479546 RepID=A0ABV7C2V1_9VIBR|nr:methyltransferase [Vibrio zhugei]
MNTELTILDRQLTLHRFPANKNETLQAWDAGDEYLIHHLEEMALADNQHILVLNDHFGALSCWFSTRHRITVMSDSFIAHQGILNNLKHNHCPEVTCLTTMDAIPDDVNIVIMQIPRNNRHLVWQLSQLRQQIPSHCQVIAVNKARDIHTSTLALFERYLGQTHTSLAWKKHRLVFSQPDAAPVCVASEIEWSVDGEAIQLHNLPNVYSGESLDQGARFMLQHLPRDPKIQNIIDLGCGNGVLSVKLGQLNPEATLTCIDESYMAVASAQKNLQVNLGNDRQTHCLANNCLDGFDGANTDLVVCNPPFHQQQAITDHIAWQMFCDAKHVLCKTGKLMVIGNRHLRYDVKLARLFGKSHVKTVAGNKKFVILEATKS